MTVPQMITSADGVNWTEGGRLWSPAGSVGWGVVWSPRMSVWVAVRYRDPGGFIGSEMVSSPDGSSWTVQPFGWGSWVATTGLSYGRSRPLVAAPLESIGASILLVSLSSPYYNSSNVFGLQYGDGYGYWQTVTGGYGGGVSAYYGDIYAAVYGVSGWTAVGAFAGTAGAVDAVTATSNYGGTFLPIVPGVDGSQTGGGHMLASHGSTILGDWSISYDDGATWTPRGTAGPNGPGLTDQVATIYADGLGWISVGAWISTSVDGVTWTLRQTPLPPPPPFTDRISLQPTLALRDIAYNGTRLVAVGTVSWYVHGSVAVDQAVVYTSVDGVTWQLVSTPMFSGTWSLNDYGHPMNGQLLSGVAWSPTTGMFIAVGGPTLDPGIGPYKHYPEMFACNLAYMSMPHTVFAESSPSAFDIQLDYCTFRGSDLSGCSFVHGYLSQSVFEDAIVVGCDFSSCNAYGVDFTNADLTGSLFRNADLYGADFSGANLTRVDFTGADLNSACFIGANLTGATIEPTRMYGNLWDHTTIWPSNITAAIASGNYDIPPPGAYLDYHGQTLVNTTFGFDDATSFMGHANFSGATLIDCRFYDAYNGHSDFSNATLQGSTLLTLQTAPSSSFRGAHIVNTGYIGGMWAHADFTGATFSTSSSVPITFDMRNGNFSYINMNDVKRSGPLQICVGNGNFSYATFRNADLTDLLDGTYGLSSSYANLSHADLTGVRGGWYEYSNLNGAVFTSADLRTSSFAGSTLAGTDFTGALLTAATLMAPYQYNPPLYTPATIFPPGIDLALLDQWAQGSPRSAKMRTDYNNTDYYGYLDLHGQTITGDPVPPNFSGSSSGDFTNFDDVNFTNGYFHWFTAYYANFVGARWTNSVFINAYFDYCNLGNPAPAAATTGWSIGSVRIA